VAHVLTQVTFECLSGAKMYSVRPCASTNTGPSPGRIAVEVRAEPDPEGLDDALVEYGVVVEVLRAATAGVLELELMLPHPPITPGSPRAARARRSLRTEDRMRAQITPSAGHLDALALTSSGRSLRVVAPAASRVSGPVAGLGER
jgi:hypothetical protein